MKILSLQIPETFEGLKPVAMTGLGDVVVLAGANGSGKSRLLRAVKHFADNHLAPEAVAEHERQIRQIESAIAHNISVVDRLEGGGLSTQQSRDEITSAKKAIDIHRGQVSKLYESLARHKALEIAPEGEVSVVTYSVVSTDLKDPGTFRLADLGTAESSMASGLSLATASNYGLAALQSLVDSYNYAGDEEKASLEERLGRLQLLLQDLLQTKVTWDGKDRLKFFGRPIANANLSNGQKVLLQIALSIFFQEAPSDRLVLLLDEPENHLHPSALLGVVDRVRSTFPKAQVWLATHSLHLLAHFDPSSIWFVNDGAIRHGGRRSLQTLNMALAGELGAGELRSFLDLPAQYAALAFAAECVVPPSVIDTLPGDPQTQQIASHIYQKVARGPIRILDFGMGKGRLISELEETFQSKGFDLRVNVDYLGFNHNAGAEDRRLCLQRIEESFGNAHERYLNELESIRRVDDLSIDLVIMCNVLHEISPADWLGLFGPGGLLTRIVKPEGSLLIVEDQILRLGEKAHDYGFIVLDNVELKCLFGVSREDLRITTVQHAEERYARRLKAHCVSGDLLMNVSSSTRRSAIEQVRDGALLELKRLRSRDLLDHHDAQSYAFWAHQFVNASVAVDAFS